LVSVSSEFISLIIPHAMNFVRFCFLALSVTFLFVYEISPEPLNGFVPNSHGRRVWSLARTSFKVKVTRDKNGIFRRFRRLASGLFGKTSLASSLIYIRANVYITAKIDCLQLGLDKLHLWSV